MNYLNKIIQISYTSIVLITIGSSAAFASSISGGAMTINFDKSALAGAFSHDADPARPAFYLEEYFDSSSYNNLSIDQLLTTHFIEGTGEISGLGRKLAVNGTVVSGRNKATSFSFDTSDLMGTASGAIGLGGAFRYRLDVPFSIQDGEEAGNRTLIGDFTLEYNESRETNGHSGWALFNHVSWRANVFDLDNVVVSQINDTLQLVGNLALGEGFDHLGGSTGAIVGDFSFQTTVVPVPAAVWFFVTGLLGLFASNKGKRNVA